ncbi:MAG: fluoride efflux transporter CrcB [Solirubrobacteraceae bacterium]
MSFVALWLGVGALGGVGALARFMLDSYVSGASGARFPLGTLLVNLTGSVLLGLLVGVALSGNAYLLAGTALIGSYTTFSTWMFESQRNAEDGRGVVLVANLLLSLALGLAAAELGRTIAGG